MKTSYQTPSIRTIVMNQSLMNPISRDIVENGQNLGTAPKTGETSGNLSKHNNLWSDPDLDEEDEN